VKTGQDIQFDYQNFLAKRKGEGWVFDSSKMVTRLLEYKDGLTALPRRILEYVDSGAEIGSVRVGEALDAPIGTVADITAKGVIQNSIL